MKKSLIMFVMLAVLTPILSFAQLNVYADYSGGKLTPTTTFFGVKKMSEKISLSYFSLVKEKWAEAQLGIIYQPAEWVQLGLSCGIEQKSSLFRTGSMLWFGSGDFSFLALVEEGIGADNYWYQITGEEKINSNISLGLRAWRYEGIGPLFEYKLKEVKLWLMPSYDFEFEKTSLIAGIKITM